MHFAESLFYLFNPSFVGMRKLAQRVNGSMMGTHNTALVTDWLIASITEETEGEFVLTTL